MPARLWFQEALLESRPETGEVQIHVSGITLRYKSRNYVDRDKHAEIEKTRLSFVYSVQDYRVAFILFVLLSLL